MLKRRSCWNAKYQKIIKRLIEKIGIDKKLEKRIIKLRDIENKERFYRSIPFIVANIAFEWIF